MKSEHTEYELEHPELIPVDEADAEARVEVARQAGCRESTREEFLRGWWALCWLNPGYHPDDSEEWPDDDRLFADEAFRRADHGDLDEAELYPSEATHDRINREFQRSRP